MTSQAEAKSTGNKEYCFTHYAVCFIDILGQRNQLKGWSELPAEGGLSEECIAAIKKTVGTVLDYANVFADYFDEFERSTTIQLDALGLADPNGMFSRFTNCQLRTQQFGDTFVFFARVPNDFGDVSVVPLYRMLTASGMAMLASLSVRTPVRGSITVGPAVELDERTLYGPALAEAYLLESTVAGYPRIIVADSVTRFLEAVCDPNNEGPLAPAMAYHARAGLSLICEDTDGNRIVDFLGGGMRTICSPAQATNQHIKRAYEFVCGECTKFKASGDTKLSKRYEELRAYMERSLESLAATRRTE